MDRLEAIRKFMSDRPNDPFPIYGLAMELRRRGDLEESRRVFASLSERFPDYVPLYLMYGELLAEMKRIEEAKEIAARGVAAARKKGDQHAAEKLVLLGASVEK